MIGRLYIDGKDAYLEYGVYVTKGGWNELVAMPPLKAIETNDWQEEDGIEPDLSAPVLDTREVQVKFAAAGLYSRLPAFLNMLSDGAYHDFNCVHIGRMYRLRLVNDGVRSVANLLDTFTLKFADDFPLRGYTYVAPFSFQNIFSKNEDYTIDGNPFTKYGARVLKGALAEVKKKPAVKTRLLRNIKTTQGAIYDAGEFSFAGFTFKIPVKFKSRDVSLTCLMRADSLTQLWRNFDALLYDLTRPYEHVFRVSESMALFYVYYKKCSVSEFYPDDKIWLKFNLTLSFVYRVPSRDIEEAFGIDAITDTSTDANTRRERITEAVLEAELPLYLGSLSDLDDIFVLATESDAIVLTEDGQNIVNLKQDYLT